MNGDRELKTADKERELEKLLAYVTNTLMDPRVYCLVVDRQPNQRPQIAIFRMEDGRASIVQCAL